MKHLFAFAAAFILLSYDQDFTVGELPIIEISTAHVIRPDEKVRGELVILDEGKEVLSTTIGVEYRGSTSFATFSSSAWHGWIRK